MLRQKWRRGFNQLKIHTKTNATKTSTLLYHEEPWVPKKKVPLIFASDVEITETFCKVGEQEHNIAEDL